MIGVSHVTRKSPSISLVTPSFNRVQFLRQAVESILTQQYAALEYVLVDGASTDGSAEVVASYADRLHWWISEPDGGQYEALNKGFAQTTGEVMGWLNSDDLHLPWTLSIVGEIFATFPEIEWLTTAFPLTWDAQGRAVGCTYRGGFSRSGFLRGEYLPTGRSYATGFMQQESTFWRRDLWQRCGGKLDIRYPLAADFDLWMRFSKEAQPYAVEVPLAGFRSHGAQRTSDWSAYLEDASASFANHGGDAYNAIETLAQRAILARLPRRARRWAAGAGLVSRRPVCAYGGAQLGWYIDER
jgi:glycosyltransferase involved in cell wall biosynthesis